MNASQVLSNQLDKLLNVSEKSKSLTKLTDNRIKLFESSHESYAKLVGLFSGNADGDSSENSPATTTSAAEAMILPIDESIDEWKKKVEEDVLTADTSRFAALKCQIDELASAIQSLHKRFSAEHQLSREWKEASRDIPDVTPTAAKAWISPNMDETLHSKCRIQK